MAASDPIDACTSADFEQAFRAVLDKVTPTHRKLLSHHYLAPDHAASTHELSAAMGWRRDAANLHYGGFAALLESFFQRPPGSDKLYLIGRFNVQRRWVLRPEVIEAARRVGLL